MEAIKSSDTNERPDLCGPCGGQCCKSIPGIYAPEDFGADLEAALRAGIKEGRVAFDYWEEDGDLPMTYYARPPVRGRLDRLVDASWGGPCSLLREEGCALTWFERPSGCRDLVPSPEGYHDCDSASHPGENSKLIQARAWSPYQDIIKRIIGEHSP